MSKYQFLASFLKYYFYVGWKNDYGCVNVYLRYVGYASMPVRAPLVWHLY